MLRRRLKTNEISLSLGMCVEYSRGDEVSNPPGASPAGLRRRVCGLLWPRRMEIVRLDAILCDARNPLGDLGPYERSLPPTSKNLGFGAAVAYGLRLVSLTPASVSNEPGQAYPGSRNLPYLS